MDVFNKFEMNKIIDEMKPVEKIIERIQPLYDNLNSRYSKSYLSGSCWYLGDDLYEWWVKSCDNVSYKENAKKLMGVIYIIK